MERLSSPELKSRGHSPHLHYFIEKMMSKDAELRYQSWDEALKDAREQVEGRASLDFKSGAARGRGRGRGRGVGSRNKEGRGTGRSTGRGRRD